MIKQRKNDPKTIYDFLFPILILTTLCYFGYWIFNYEEPYNPNKVAVQNAMWEIRLEEKAKEDSLHSRIERLSNFIDSGGTVIQDAALEKAALQDAVEWKFLAERIIEDELKSHKKMYFVWYPYAEKIGIECHVCGEVLPLFYRRDVGTKLDSISRHTKESLIVYLKANP